MNEPNENEQPQPEEPKRISLHEIHAAMIAEMLQTTDGNTKVALSYVVQSIALTRIANALEMQAANSRPIFVPGDARGMRQ